MTAADLPQPVPRFGPQIEDRPVIAVGETKYHGEPVALVVGRDEGPGRGGGGARARRARGAAAGLHARGGARRRPRRSCRIPSLRPDDRLAATNVLQRAPRSGWGDVDAADGRGRLVVEHRYTFPMVTHFAIEPHAFMAAPDGDGMAVWSTIQHPNWLQKVIASVAGHAALEGARVRARPGRRVRWQAARQVEPAVVFAALQARPPRAPHPDPGGDVPGRPPGGVRGPGPDRRSTATARIVFQDIEADYLIGAYADIADRVVGKGSYPAAGPYNVPAVRILARSVLSHTAPSTAFRGFGNPQINWAVESNLDEGARALGMDRLEIRLHNLARKGDAFIPFDTPADGDWEQTVRRAAELIGWGTPLPPGRGRGIAAGHQVRPDHRPQLLHRPAARRRERGRARRAPRTWARAPGPSSPRSPPRSWAPRWTGSPSSWATRRSCPTTSRRRPAARRS